MTEGSARRVGTLRYIFSTRVVRRNCLIALIVGSLLTLVYQFEVLFSAPMVLQLAAKIVLNFLIPFVVSSTSAAVSRPPGASA